MTDTLVGSSLGEELTPLRGELDEIEAVLIPAAIDRFLKAREIGQVKQRHGAEVIDPEREKVVIAKYAEAFARRGLPAELGVKFGTAIVTIGQDIQFLDMDADITSGV